MVIRFHEVVDREVVLAIVESRATPDDLLEFDNGVDWAHEDDITDVAGIHAGGQLLRCCKDSRNGLFVVLEGT